MLLYTLSIAIQKLDDIVYYKYSYQYYLQNFIMVIWFIISFPVANSIIY